jgi:hypothetical protein
MTPRLHGAQLSTLQDSCLVGCRRSARWFAKVSSKRHLGDGTTPRKSDLGFYPRIRVSAVKALGAISLEKYSLSYFAFYSLFT